MTLRRAGKVSLTYFVVTVFVIFTAFPFYWMLIATFKTSADIYKPINNPFIFNQPPTLDNLTLLFNQTNYLVFVVNSLIVGVVVVLITVVLAVPAAYSLARLAGRWGDRLAS